MTRIRRTSLFPDCLHTTPRRERNKAVKLLPLFEVETYNRAFKIGENAVPGKVSSSQYPQENFQANDDIVGSAVYQLGKDIVVEIDGQYWSCCAVSDVDYTTNDDGTYACRGNTYKYMIEVSGIDGSAQVTYIILTSIKETGFEDVRYSLKKQK